MLKKLILPLIAVLAAFGIFQYVRPVPPVSPVTQIASVPKTQAINLPWPSAGQAAIGASGYGVLASHNTNAPVPVASIAKIITALALLKQKPIATGTQGATITLDATDVQIYNDYFTKDGSVAQVTAGEQLTEVQALQTMLIPSANNMADSLARWAFGSVDAYVTYANQMIKTMGLKNTQVGDASGFGDNTTSTADDLVKLGIAALNNPSIAQVVSQSSAQVPVAGTVKNVNWLLGQNGVVGIKTGNTDKAGGCYLFASQRNISSHNIKLVGAVLSQPDLTSAISAAPPLIQASDSGFQQITVVHNSQVFGEYHSAWGSAAQAKSGKELALFVWKGADIKIVNEPETLNAPAKAGNEAGTVTVQSSQQTARSPIILSRDIPSPSFWWRITR